MSGGFTKLFSSITESTVWGEPYPTRILWVAMLAMADREGRVNASVPGLARRAGITLEECEAALLKFQQPDKYSRTPDYEGRRIEAVDGGWRLLNHAKYRNLRDEDAKRAADAERQRRHRAFKARAPSADGHGQSVTERDARDTHAKSQKVAQAEAEAEAEKEKPLARERARGEPDGFAEFYNAYPLRVGRPKAAQAFKKAGLCAADLPALLAAVRAQASSTQWTKDGGQFVPHPATWINQRRWEDAAPKVNGVLGHVDAPVLQAGDWQ